MGAYLSSEQYLAEIDTVKKEEIDDEKSMEDCKTQDEMSLYFRNYNDENSLEDYCDLAKRKLPKISNLQKQKLIFYFLLQAVWENQNLLCLLIQIYYQILSQ